MVLDIPLPRELNAYARLLLSRAGSNWKPGCDVMLFGGVERVGKVVYAWNQKVEFPDRRSAMLAATELVCDALAELAGKEPVNHEIQARVSKVVSHVAHFRNSLPEPEPMAITATTRQTKKRTGKTTNAHSNRSGHASGLEAQREPSTPWISDAHNESPDVLRSQLIGLQARACCSDDEEEIIASALALPRQSPWGHDFRARVVALLLKYGLLRKPGQPPAVSQETTAAEHGNKAGESIDQDEPDGVEISDDIFVVPIDELVRHPQNRHPKKSRVDELAKSLLANGQRDPLKVRRVGTKWQILSGESRMLAGRQIGLKVLKARKVVCDDAQAFKILGEENSERTDLDDIEKAEYVAIAVAPIAEGGYGLRWEDAARRVGLESDSAAKNLVRLLDLPKEWRERVATGELPQTFARELLRVAKWPRLMAHVDEEWKLAARGRAKQAAGENTKWKEDRAIETFESRSAIEKFIGRIIDKETRPVDGKTTIHYDYDVVKMYGVYEPRLFKLDDAIRAELEIGIFRINKKEVERATNAAAFDRLNVPLVKQRIAEKQKRTARDLSSRDEKKSSPKRESTPAELKARATEQAKQLAARVRGWRHRWLCDLCAELIANSPSWPAYRFALWMVSWHDTSAIRGRWQEVIGKADPWACLGRLPCESNPQSVFCAEAHLAKLREVSAAYLSTLDIDPRRPRIPFAVVDDLAEQLGIDLAGAWRAAQGKDSPRRPHWEAFFELFQSGQLDELGDDIGVFVAAAKGRAAKVRLFTTASRVLALPKCLGKIAGNAKKQKTR